MIITFYKNKREKMSKYITNIDLEKKRVEKHYDKKRKLSMLGGNRTAKTNHC